MALLRLPKKNTAAGAAVPPVQLAPADAFFAWLEARFVFTAGPKRGQPLRLDPFQQAYVRQVLARDGDDPAHRICIFSTPRKQGKTAVLSCLLLGFMLPDSPICIPMCRAGIAAPTGRHAMFIFQAAIELLAAVGRDDEAKVIQHPSPGFFRTKGGARCDIYSGSKNSGHGASLHLAMIDEAGLLPDNRPLIDNFVDALAIENGQMLATGTRGTNRAYNDLIDNPPKGVAVTIYGAQPGDDYGSPETWHRANPGLGPIKSLKFMRDQWEKAKAGGTTREFAAWNLNVRQTPAKELLIELPQLQAAYDEKAGPVPGEPCFIGLDLGGPAAQTAAVIVYQSGFIRLIAAFPDQPITLEERGHRDGCGGAYRAAHDAGDLITTSGQVTDLSEFLEALTAKIGPHPVASVSCDRYRAAELLTALSRAGIPWRPRFRGQGPKDGNADILATRKLFLAGAMKLHRSQLLELALGETDCRVSFTGATQLDKSSRMSRIDLAQALVLGCSAMLEDREAIPAEYEVEVL